MREPLGLDRVLETKLLEFVEKVTKKWSIFGVTKKWSIFGVTKNCKIWENEAKIRPKSEKMRPKSGQIESKRGQMRPNWVKKRPNEAKWGKTVGHSAVGHPGPVPRGSTRVRTTPRYPITRVPHHPRTPLLVSWPSMLPRVWELGSGSPGFFRIQSIDQNTTLVKTAIFLMSKTDLLKMTFLTKIPTLSS